MHNHANIRYCHNYLLLPTSQLNNNCHLQVNIRPANVRKVFVTFPVINTLFQSIPLYQSLLARCQSPTWCQLTAANNGKNSGAYQQLTEVRFTDLSARIVVLSLNFTASTRANSILIAKCRTAVVRGDSCVKKSTAKLQNTYSLFNSRFIAKWKVFVHQQAP